MEGMIMNARDRKRFFKSRQEQYGGFVADRRTEIYFQAQKLEDTLQVYLREEADHKRTEMIYFQPSRGPTRERKVRVVYFNAPVRIYDPEGITDCPIFWCLKLGEMPADGKDFPKEWVLENEYGDQVHMRDLSVDDLLLISDRLFDDDCSLNPAWTRETLL
jgi:hypothetical protein